MKKKKIVWILMSVMHDRTHEVLQQFKFKTNRIAFSPKWIWPVTTSHHCIGRLSFVESNFVIFFFLKKSYDKKDNFIAFSGYSTSVFTDDKS